MNRHLRFDQYYNRNIMTYLLQTARMRIRPVRPDDAEPMLMLFQEPETMRYVGGPITTLDEVQKRLDVYLNYAEKKPGLGTFIVESNESGKMMGICVARQAEYDVNSDLFEVGYILAPEYWGQGFVSELLPRLCEYLIERSGASQLVAYTHPENTTSQHLLKKVGFVETGTHTDLQGRFSISFVLSYVAGRGEPVA